MKASVPSYSLLLKFSSCMLRGKSCYLLPSLSNYKISPALRNQVLLSILATSHATPQAGRFNGSSSITLRVTAVIYCSHFVLSHGRGKVSIIFAPRQISTIFFSIPLLQLRVKGHRCSGILGCLNVRLLTLTTGIPGLLSNH